MGKERYQNKELLGKGNMGVVYKAYDTLIKKPVALKYIREDLLGAPYLNLKERFLTEGRYTMDLTHENIVRVHNVEEYGSELCIIMEYIEGQPLSNLIDKKKLSLKDIIYLGIQVADALDYAHEKGIVHRDVKPENIMIQENGQIKITDFGIAHIRDKDVSAFGKTQIGEKLGTPYYMSPEQVKEEELDGRSDIFSLGVILYSLTTGTFPFEGKTMTAMSYAIVNNNPVKPCNVDTAIPVTLSNIIMKCLEKNPDARFKRGMDLADELENFLEKIEETTASKPPASHKKRLLFITAGVLAISLSIAFIIKFIYPPQELTLTASLDRTPACYPTGSSVRIHIESEPEAYLYILKYAADKTISLVYPNKFLLNKSRDDRIFEFPPHELSKELDLKVYPLVQNSNALEKFKVIVSRQELDFSFFKPVFEDRDYLMIGTENQMELNNMLGVLNNNSSKVKDLPYDVGPACSE